MKKKNIKKLQLSKDSIAQLRGGLAHPMGEYKERVKYYVGTRNTCQCETIASPC
ncbi:hypothetical protein [Aquimarina spongiae]|uniref:Uncharacterized protein n=1 Tax=Aquimarina spongiae TaxID=570521 RepID=A0A1M6CRH4_9FLAO|nr:hypothetical protein [Aquimarina spongiae]SHI63338.1 hypothetical protein SAMN04488508_102234 [Aquimarina spongiae]